MPELINGSLPVVANAVAVMSTVATTALHVDAIYQEVVDAVAGAT